MSSFSFLRLPLSPLLVFPHKFSSLLYTKEPPPPRLQQSTQKMRNGKCHYTTMICPAQDTRPWGRRQANHWSETISHWYLEGISPCVFASNQIVCQEARISGPICHLSTKLLEEILVCSQNHGLSAQTFIKYQIRKPETLEVENNPLFHWPDCAFLSHTNSLTLIPKFVHTLRFIL